MDKACYQKPVTFAKLYLLLIGRNGVVRLIMSSARLIGVQISYKPRFWSRLQMIIVEGCISLVVFLSFNFSLYFSFIWSSFKRELCIQFFIWYCWKKIKHASVLNDSHCLFSQFLFLSQLDLEVCLLRLPWI